jgi:Ax21 family sulfation-dependent quorum factor
MKRALLTLSLLAALPLAASAAENANGLNYNYLEGGYAATNTDAGDADGWALNGSAAFTPNWSVFGAYSNQEIDDTNVDFDQWRLGVGYNHPLGGSNTDLVTRAAYEKFDAGAGADFDGYSAEVGVRSALTSNLEGYALAGYEDGDQYDGDFYGRLGAQVKFNQNWGITGDVKFADGDTQYFVGPRLTF